MAAATVADGPFKSVIGKLRISFAKLTAPADTNTWDSGLLVVQAAFVQQLGDIAAGTDVITIDTISGSTLTFSVDGTARDVYVVALGY